jgi:uncharacterized repeat protein (TIGR01451 family)
MSKIIGLGIVICLAMLIIAPVAACHAEVTKTSDEFVCTTCDSFPYTINVKSVSANSNEPNFLVRVTDTLPSGLEYVSYVSDLAPSSVTCVSPTSVLDSSCKVIQFDYINVPNNAEWKITLNVKPVGQSDGSSVMNTVTAKVKRFSTSSFEPLGTKGSASATTTFENDLCPIPSPEFPTMALPAGLIVGIFGVILFIQKTKEN